MSSLQDPAVEAMQHLEQAAGAANDAHLLAEDVLRHKRADAEEAQYQLARAEADANNAADLSHALDELLSRFNLGTEPDYADTKEPPAFCEMCGDVLTGTHLAGCPHGAL